MRHKKASKESNKRAGRLADKQTRQYVRQTNRQAYNKTGRQLPGIQAAASDLGKQADKKAHKQANRQTDVCQQTGTHGGGADMQTGTSADEQRSNYSDRQEQMPTS